jgi:hypothetical protein
MDLKIRTEVLEIALQIEKSITDLLMSYLSVSVEKRKGITNTSGGLNFKNKIDLLHDIQVLNKNEHFRLNLIMEFRNQFMHNFECNTFQDAVGFLGTGPENKLLEYLTAEEAKDDPKNYELAFNNLFSSAAKMILEKNELRNTALNENAITVDRLFDGFISLTKFYDSLRKLTIEGIAASTKNNNVALMNFQHDLLNLTEILEREKPYQVFEDIPADKFKKVLRRIANAAIE